MTKSIKSKPKKSTQRPHERTRNLVHDLGGTPTEFRSLSLDSLRLANICRLPLFKNALGETAHSKKDGSDWSLAEWSNAVAGEVGELCNLTKKILRGDFTVEEYHDALADEMADILIYLDIVALQANINLSKAVIRKFNRVSDKQGIPIHM